MTQSSSVQSQPPLQLGEHGSAPSLSYSTPVWLITAVWFTTVMWLAIQGTFDAPAGEAPIAMIAAAGVPPVLFWIAYLAIPSLNRWVLSQDLAELTAMQAWRIIGAAFLFAWGVNVLPPIFALPAGIGDILVGVAAPVAALAVARASSNASKAAWGIVIAGMTDFIIVVSIGIGAREGMLLHLDGHLSTMAMGQAPFVLFPVFLVPAFIILHIMAIAKLLNQ
ncbi:MAG: hypothetical protein HKP43_06615 [Altererythrobacter sp.]|nr:hypothetical protein [Altererythrobacter sp.]NNK46280.1 hypothetical protein [Altererythrobacter sp.]